MSKWIVGNDTNRSGGGEGWSSGAWQRPDDAAVAVMDHYQLAFAEAVKLLPPPREQGSPPMEAVAGKGTGAAAVAAKGNAAVARKGKAEGNAAVAAEMPRMPTVAAEPPEQPEEVVGLIVVDPQQPRLTVEYFQQRRFKPGYKQHNAALKWYRADCEANDERHMCLNVGEEIPVVMHPKGMEFYFSPDEKTHWCWYDMLSQLDKESLEYVVKGPENRSCGVVACMVAPRPNSYDHKRHHALRLANTPVEDRKLQVWDLVIIRGDGSGIRLHPQWSTTKIETFPIQGYHEPVEHPAPGYGRSLGRGTYKWFKETVGTAKILRFDVSGARGRGYP